MNRVNICRRAVLTASSRVPLARSYSQQDPEAQARRHTLREPHSSVNQRERELLGESDKIWSSIAADIGKLETVTADMEHLQHSKVPPSPGAAAFRKGFGNISRLVWAVAIGSTVLAVGLNNPSKQSYERSFLKK